MHITKYSHLPSIGLILMFVGCAFAQSGGPFGITKSVVSSSGIQTTSGGNFSVSSTAGEAIAGDVSSSSQFIITGGFWQVEPIGPTAAAASISGRICKPDASGITNVILKLANPANGQVMTARSSAFGYYRFNDVPSGQTYILILESKRFVFTLNPRVISVTDDLADIDFVADPL